MLKKKFFNFFGLIELEFCILVGYKTMSYGISKTIGQNCVRETGTKN